MEVHYERQMRHNYLIIESENSESENYECRMLMANTIEGLLKFRFQKTENGLCYYYEITSKQPLNRILEGRAIRREEIAQLIMSIAAILDRVESYLLKENRILLDPEYIYIDPEGFRVFLCLVPDRDIDFSKTMEMLLQYLLKKVDHKEKDTVLLAYRLYQESQKEFYGIENLLKWLPGEEKEVFAEAEGQKQEKDFAVQEEDRLQKEILKEVKKPDGIRQKTDWKKRIGITAGILLAPGAIWIIKGDYFFKEYPLLLASWYAVWGIVGISLWIIRRIFPADVEEKNAAETGDEINLKKESLWAVEFAEEKSPEKPLPEMDFEKTMSKPDLDIPDTVLETRILTSGEKEKKAVHYLQSIDKGTEDILMAYFPFIIGKQSGIVDFVLNKDTVSRLHVKIEETESGYTITDLNSTNGTRVRGEMLQNNQQTPLESGDEVYIADNGFRFM